MRNMLMLALFILSAFIVLLLFVQSRALIFFVNNTDLILSGVEEMESVRLEDIPIQQEEEKTCDLCEDNWLFILSTGRSGSTTIIEMLNTLPGVKLTGENDGAVGTLFKLPFFPGSPNSYAFSPSKPADGAFEHGTVDIKSLYCWIQQYFRLISGKEYTGEDVQINGFKTIRIFDFKQLQFMTRIFPCGKFILNFRKDQKKGEYKHWSSEEALRNNKKKLFKFSYFFPKNTIFFPLESFGLEQYNKLIEWIGFVDCAFGNVSHANDNGGFKPDHSASIEGSCVLEDFGKSFRTADADEQRYSLIGRKPNIRRRPRPVEGRPMKRNTREPLPDSVP